MEKFVPYEKLSKKKQREWNAKRRGTWGALNPVTRKVESKKIYNRQKARKWSDDSPTVPFAFCAVRIDFGGDGGYNKEKKQGGTVNEQNFSGLFFRHRQNGQSGRTPCRGLRRRAV